MGAILAIDIGGTQIRVAAYPRDSIEQIKVVRTSTKADGGSVYDRLVEQIEAVWPVGGAEAISAAIAGPVDPQTGVIVETPNIKGWENFPLGEKLTRRFKVPAFLGNDANLAALGEWRYGAGQGHHDVLYLTISTGIGGGVINNDQLVLGVHGLATELGHVTVLRDGPLCSCGQRGHLEAMASGTGIVRYVTEKLAGGASSSLSSVSKLDARAVAEAARQGDALARAAFDQAGDYLGQALADYLHIFNPSIVIFGGGVSQSGPLLFDPARESMQRHLMSPTYMKGLELAQAKLKDDVGLIGAAVQAQLKLG